tara:strand:+ start:169 stop:309 length:141 start_codon:yes stop_codon:yes gene_type:complete
MKSFSQKENLRLRKLKSRFLDGFITVMDQNFLVFIVWIKLNLARLR